MLEPDFSTFESEYASDGYALKVSTEEEHANVFLRIYRAEQMKEFIEDVNDKKNSGVLPRLANFESLILCPGGRENVERFIRFLKTTAIMLETNLLPECDSIEEEMAASELRQEEYDLEEEEEEDKEKEEGE